MNLILKMENCQEKEHLELLINVKVIKIKQNILLKKFNKQKVNLNFKKYKYHNKQNKMKMLYNIMIFIFGLIQDIMITLSLILLLLKWKQQKLIQ